MDLLNDFYAKYNIHGIMAGNTGCQMGGWFRKEIKTPADLSGLKMRIGGFAGQVLAKLGLVPQQIAAGDIYPALEKGTIDAAEWVGPYDDEKLGFYKVAQYYYYPGFWEGGPQLQVFVNNGKWNELPKTYQAILRECRRRPRNTVMQARYDARNPAALKRLVAAGAQLRPFPPEIMDACLQGRGHELYAETSAKNPEFKKLYEGSLPFRNDGFLWWQVAEDSFDNFMIRNRAKSLSRHVAKGAVRNRPASERDVVQYGELETFAVGLLAMINPIGGAAIFAAKTEKLSSSERAAMAHTASLAVAVLLLVATWLGKPLLALLSISVPAFEVAGGLIVLRIALGMLQHGAAGFAAPPDAAAGKAAGQAVLGMAVVPLAMPMLIGPGAMATVIIQTHKQPAYTDALAVSAVCLGMALIVWACLHLAAPMSRLLGSGGVDVLTRILGLLLAAIAIGMIASGLGGLFPRLV